MSLSVAEAELRLKHPEGTPKEAKDSTNGTEKRNHTLAQPQYNDQRSANEWVIIFIAKIAKSNSFLK